MSNYRQMAPAAYLVAALLFFIPFFDALASVAPWHPFGAQWRFGAIGLISNAFMIPAAGALIAVGTALTYSHYKTQLWFGIVCWLMTLVVVLGMLSFSLDAIQTRTALRPDIYRSYEVGPGPAEP